MSPYEKSILCNLARLAIGADALNGRFEAGFEKLTSIKARQIAEGLRNRSFEDPMVSEFAAWAKRELSDTQAVVSC